MKFILLLGAFSWLQTGISDAADVAGPPDATKPNVIIVFIDDMGWGDLSCFGGEAVQTEQIDQLASEGLRFHQFYVNSPICSPSRTAILTGQYPQRWDIRSYLADRKLNKKRGMAQWLDPSAPTLARSLQRVGYATGQFGKWHMGGQRDVGEAPLITAYGFDESLTNFEGLGPRVLPLCFEEPGAEPRRHALGSARLGRGPIRWEDRSLITKAFVDAAVGFIDDAANRRQPFYINVWPDDVHSPFFPPFDERGDGSKRDRYYGVLDTMDEQLEPLFERVRNDEELAKNTIILVCSDNGPEPGAGSAGPFRGAKTMLYEGGIRSPLIVWAPGLVAAEAAGTINRVSVFSALDLMPSLQKITGAESDANSPTDGEELSDMLLGRSQASRKEPLFFSRPPDRKRSGSGKDLPDLAVRDGKWKLLCEYDGSDVQLFDVEEDRGERQNLADQQRAIVDRLLPPLLAWWAEVRPEPQPAS